MPGIEAPLGEAAAVCVQAYRAGSNAVPAFAQAGDLAGETVAKNMPDRDKEHPNWRCKLRVPVQTLFALGSAQAILEAVRSKRDKFCYCN